MCVFPVWPVVRGNWATKNPSRGAAGKMLSEERSRLSAQKAYFCHVRFLWRLAFKRLRRLCLFIWRRRFFFRLPMVVKN